MTRASLPDAELENSFLGKCPRLRLQIPYETSMTCYLVIVEKTPLHTSLHPVILRVGRLTLDSYIPCLSCDSEISQDMRSFLDN